MFLLFHTRPNHIMPTRSTQSGNKKKVKKNHFSDEGTILATLKVRFLLPEVVIGRDTKSYIN